MTREFIDSEINESAHPLEAQRSTGMSLNLAVLDALRADLLSGRIAPGIRLKVPTLCQRYSVSPGAAREALSRLVAEGLVDFADQRGFRSATLTIEALYDITNVRILIETKALEGAIANGDMEWEFRVRFCEQRLRDLDSSTVRRFAEWSSRHKDFHLALVEGCGSPWLIRLHSLTYDQAERYRQIAASMRRRGAPRSRNVESEHQELARLALNRDVQGATALIKLHLLSTRDYVEAAIAEYAN